MPLSYSNRSAAHADLEMYQAALRDIELAFEHGITGDKKRKLCMRRIDCFLNLNKEEEAMELLEQLSVHCKDDLTQLKERIIQKVLNKEETLAYQTGTNGNDMTPTVEHSNRFL